HSRSDHRLDSPNPRRSLMRRLATFDERDSQPTIVTADHIHTVDEANPSAEAMFIAGGIIRAIGSRSEVETAASGSNPVRIDRPGATIVPGFVDAHAHPLMYGQMLTWIDVSPEKASTIPEIIELMREGAKRLPAGTPIRGYGYEQRNLAERRHPRKEEL